MHRSLIFAAVIFLPTALLVAAESAAGFEPPGVGRNFTLAHPGISMVWVAPGTFLVCSTLGTGDDTQVTLTRGYWLGRTEVTQGQWQRLMDHNPVPSSFKGSERPVECVDWDSVMVFCRRLTESESRAGRLAAGYVYSLPTEAQWEYACRAGTTGIFAGNLDSMGWYDANAEGQTHPVGQKQPNAWGLYDMYGNVIEWCLDWYAAYPGGSVSDLFGTGSRQFHVLRGGSWNSPGGQCRSGLRHWNPTSGGNSGIGFRLALVPVTSALLGSPVGVSESEPSPRK